MAASRFRVCRSLLAALRPVTTPRHTTHIAIPRRHASTSSTSSESLLVSRVRVALFTTAVGASLFVIYVYTTDTRAGIHRLVPPLLRVAYPDAEAAHHVSTAALGGLYALGLHPRERVPETADLAVSVFGTTLANPVGISAGLDKDAEIPDALFALGAAVVEVGGCTPRPQAGNPRPRVWRIPILEGLVNRYGLNSAGADAMAAKLRARQAREVGRDVPGRLLLVQIAKNKDTNEQDVEAVAADYVYAVQRLAPYADVLVVNVSSPNTPGLRELQASEPLTRILSAVVDEAGKLKGKKRPRVMVKVSPDEDGDADVEGICQAVWASGVDGVIVGNTTKRRTGLVPDGVKMSTREQTALTETGGFSGPAMFERTLGLVGRYRKTLDGRSFRSGAGVGEVSGGTAVGSEAPETSGQAQKVIFATGGITNGQQALKVLNAGASVAMVYTGLVYGGAGTITKIKGEMRAALKQSAV